MRHESSKQIFATWQQQRGKDAAPDRARFSPADFGRGLKDVFLLEQDDAGEYRFRIAGTSLCALFGGEMRGETFVSVMTHASLADAREILAAAAEDVLPVVAGASAVVKAGRGLETEMLLLPMFYRGRSDRRIFGALSYTAPDRTLLGECAGLDILSFRTISEGDAPMLVHPASKVTGLHKVFDRRARLIVHQGGHVDPA